MLIFFSMTVKSQTAEEKMRLALKFQEEKEYGKSNKHLIDLYSTNDMKELVCLNLAKNYLAISNEKLAEKYATECIDIRGDYSKEASLIKGWILESNEQYDEAAVLYDKMLERFKDNYDLLLAKAYLYCQQPEKQKERCRAFHKAIKCEPLNVKTHSLIANYEYSKRHYTQAILAELFAMIAHPGKVSVKKIDEIYKNRQIKDAMQDVIYGNENEVSETETEMYWAMAFIPELEKCEMEYDREMPDAECFIDNTKELVDKICTSVATCKIEEERTHSDFYVDFFSQLMRNDLMDEFLYYVLMTSYANVYEYIPGMSKARMNRFADFLEEYFK